MKKTTFLLSLILLCLCTYSQVEKKYLLMDHVCDLIFKDSATLFADSTLNNKGITSAKVAFPYTKNDTLMRLYRIECIEDSINTIKSHKSVVDMYIIEENKISTYTPSDYMWNCYNNNGINYLWHLKKIKADLAWDITQGDSDIKIAILDTWFDINHPDLVNQMYCNYDPYDNTMFSSNPIQKHHGTTVASFAAAQTDGGGQLAGIGFNCKIIPYQAWNGDYLERAHHASLAMNADVLTSSAGGWSCNCEFNDIERIVVREILDNGTVIVMPAGNGINSNSHCYNSDLNSDQPWRPLHPHYDERIIIVSSTDTLDYHTFIDSNNNTDHTHSHYADVDICAPGYNTMGAICSLHHDGTPNTWPYYGSCVGTSFSTPIVAGVCALIKSVNRCLSPADIQYIIKTTADPIADASQYPGLVGAGRINAYQAVLMAKSYSDTVFISSNTTWASERKVHGHIVIEPNATLTVTNTLKLGKDVKIIIKPAGKLVVDGGTITNLCCDDMWNGIYVVGNYNQRQLPQYQGSIEVTNSSVISNAKNAISTWDGDDYNSTGGIVQCTNSTFSNNRRCAEFMAYTNHDANNQECNNVSYFKDCDFIINDANIFSSAGVTYSDMITMWGVNGIAIRGCHFSDNRTGLPTRGNAITLAGAGVNIKPSCAFNEYNINTPCTCLGESSNTFYGFTKGVKAENTGTNYPFYVFKTNFSLCEQSVYSSAVNDYEVTMSNFNLTGVESLLTIDSYGLYSSNSTGYKIEGNSVYTTNTTPVFCTTYGIYMAGSGTSANTIYRNTFNKLDYGIYTSNNPGLQVSCNELSNIFNTDIYVVSSFPFQGTSSSSAGNKFTSGTTNINSGTSFWYFYSGTANTSNPYYPASTTSNVTKRTGTANNCTPTICTQTINPKSVSADDDIALYDTLQQMYESRLAEYNAAGYGFLLENFNENDAGIVAAAMQKHDTLISLSSTMAEIANRNMEAIFKDTVMFDREALNGWYNRINTTTAKYSLVNSYFEVGNYDLARQELALIPQRFALTTDELAEYDNFCQYNVLRESVYSSGRNYARLTEDEIAELQTIVERNTGVSSAYANSVLCFFYGICREDEKPETDDDAPINSKSTTAVAEESTETEPIAIYVYPNPAEDELNILLNTLPEGKTMIEFHDVTGRLVLSEEIRNNSTSINISPLKQGVYMYRIVNGDNVIARDRIVKE